MKSLTRLGVAILLMIGGLFPALAEDYPNKPIRLIVSYPPGGGVDLSGRIVAEALSQRLGQQVVVENRPGASGTIGGDYAAKSPADGYTLLWASTDAMTIVPAVKRNTPYRIPEDFSFIAKFAETGMSFVISSKLPVTSLTEFIAYGKQNPGKLRYGTSGVGGSIHLGTLLFEKYAGVKTTHIPYKGVAPTLTDLLGGHIEFALVTPITMVPHLASDKIRVIGVTAPARHPLVPNAPTMTEAGLPQATMTVWYGLLGPNKLPAPVRERLQKEVAAIIESPAIKEKFAAAGLLMAPLFGGQFEKAVVDEYDRWKAIAGAENIVVED